MFTNIFGGVKEKAAIVRKREPVLCLMKRGVLRSEWETFVAGVEVTLYSMQPTARARAPRNHPSICQKQSGSSPPFEKKFAHGDVRTQDNAFSIRRGHCPKPSSSKTMAPL